MVPPFAWLAMCAFVAGLSLPAYDMHAMGDTDDAACRVVGGWTAPNAQRIATPTTSTGEPEHCVYCHWLRAVAGAKTSEGAALSSPRPAALVVRTGARTTLTASPIANSPRAPPVATSI